MDSSRSNKIYSYVSNVNQQSNQNLQSSSASSHEHQQHNTIHSSSQQNPQTTFSYAHHFVTPHYYAGDHIQDSIANMPVLNFETFDFNPDDYDSEEEFEDSAANFAHFQYPPRSAASLKSEKMPNPFSEGIELIPTSSNHAGNQKRKAKLSNNHQTFVCKHRQNYHEDANLKQRSFKNHTKICRISDGGIRIVTDIFRDDNQPTSNFNGSPSISQKSSTRHASLDNNMNEWREEIIKVTVAVNSNKASAVDRDIDDEDANDVREDC